MPCWKSETGNPFSRKLMYAKVTSKSGTAPTAYTCVGTVYFSLRSNPITLAILIPIEFK